MSICIVDYKAGNTKSVSNLLNRIEKKHKISSNNLELKNSTHIILPGVGSYSSVMNNLKKHVDIDYLNNLVLIKKKPILGICVGMQIMSDYGYENEKTIGLSWIGGSVKKIDTNLVLPHVGWNKVNFKENIFNNNGADSDLDFYFVHSYKFITNKQEDKFAITHYGEEFVSAVRKENILGCQFHPEKSQVSGLNFVKYFLNNFN